MTKPLLIALVASLIALVLFHWPHEPPVDVAPAGWEQLPDLGCPIKGSVGVIYLTDCEFFI